MKIRYLLLSLLLPLLLTGCNSIGSAANEVLGASYSDATWKIVNSFTGYKTKLDPQKIDDGANPNGQNTTIGNGDRVSIRNYGATVLGTSTTTEDSITSLHTFRKRSGDNILMRSRGTYLEFFDETYDKWEALRTTSTDNAVYDYADYNINTDLRSYVYFGNGSDNWGRWGGANTNFTIAPTSSAKVLFVTDTTDGFFSSGEIMYCGQRIPYTSKTDTTFVVASAHACDINRAIAIAPEEDSANPKGNIYLVANNRLFISGVASSTQAVWFSKYGDADTFLNTLVADGTDDAAGIFNLGEGGGGVTAMAQDEGAIYIFKKSIIYKVTLSDTLYTLVPLKTFDGKSQTIGAVARKSVFTGGNGVFWITPDNRILYLSRIDGFDYPQVTAISDIIKPTTDAMVYASSTGIVFEDKFYLSSKASSDSVTNDATLVYNIQTNQWDSPIVGWQANDWIVYDNGTREELYYGDASLANVYQITDDAIDNTLGITANWRSKQYDFGQPHQLKEVVGMYVDGYISPNTDLEISLLADEDGYTQTYTTTLSGTDTDYIYSSEEYNTFGLSPFGYQNFSSNDDQGEIKKFRIYLTQFKMVPAYNYQLEFKSDGVGDNWQILDYGLKWRTSTQPEKKSLFKAFR